MSRKLVAEAARAGLMVYCPASGVEYALFIKISIDNPTRNVHRHWCNCFLLITIYLVITMRLFAVNQTYMALTGKTGLLLPNDSKT
jgi:hypothetical protein